jgi:hypothetical protein
MEQEIHITLRFNLAIGKVTLNEIVYKLKELRDPLMLKILEHIVRSYDDIIAERLSRTDLYPSKARKGLGRHVRKGDPEQRFCRGRKVVKIGYRKKPRTISTVLGNLSLPIRETQCLNCGARYSPLLTAPKTTSLLERVFREIGRRLKRIAWGWSDAAVTNISKMIMIKQYSRDKWEKYWKEKLGIKGYFDSEIRSTRLSACTHF